MFQNCLSGALVGVLGSDVIGQGRRDRELGWADGVGDGRGRRDRWASIVVISIIVIHFMIMTIMIIMMIIGWADSIGR